MANHELNKALVYAVSTHDVWTVKDCLEKGADPNYYWPVEEYGIEDKYQPNTPLRLVVFAISDSMLEDNDLKAFAEIAKLLLEHGADPKPAMELAGWRYGKYDPHTASSPFMDVWHIVADAAKKN